MSTRNSVRGPIMHYLSKHENKVVYINDIMADTGLDRVTALRGMAAIVYKGLPLEVITSSNAWRWSPDGQTAKKVAAARDRCLYEQIGKTRSGAILVESEDGVIYKLTELE